MAFVLALLIVGWLLAFAIGAQTGFDSEANASATAQPDSQQVAPVAYKKATSVS